MLPARLLDGDGSLLCHDDDGDGDGKVHRRRVDSSDIGEVLPADLRLHTSASGEPQPYRSLPRISSIP